MTGDAFWDAVRGSIVGADAVIATCFGPRRLVYADWTASGRAVGFVEDHLRGVLETYANTHTEDDATGMLTTERLDHAERTIKRLVNAGDDYALILTGSGTTGAIERLQQILGLSVAPAARERLHGELVASLGAEAARRAVERARAARPVVFVGPYEHHSNELSWRESDAEVVEVDLDDRGLLDLGDLDRKAGDPRYSSRLRIGALSACSNVSGIRTPVHEAARILHRRGCLAFFDFAALAPYARIDVRRDAESFFDAIYFSPHKLLGGPGAAGVLVLRRALYRSDLPPTFAGGGTVDFVDWTSQDYVADLESRERAGTPGILQALRASLALELKERLGEERIEAREAAVTRMAMERLGRIPGLGIMGNLDPANRISIVSFVIRLDRGYLHPRFVTRLLNDLFGIQSRAGCLCAGPYGHRLLGIDRERSAAFRRAVREGHGGLKPGWTRLSFHYLMTDEEIGFVCDAVDFVARHGAAFLGQYELDLAGGAWNRPGRRTPPAPQGIDAALASAAPAPLPAVAPGPAACLAEASRLARELEGSPGAEPLRVTDPTLVPFLYVHATEGRGGCRPHA